MGARLSEAPAGPSLGGSGLNSLAFVAFATAENGPGASGATDRRGSGRGGVRRASAARSGLGRERPRRAPPPCGGRACPPLQRRVAPSCIYRKVYADSCIRFQSAHFKALEMQRYLEIPRMQWPSAAP